MSGDAETEMFQPGEKVKLVAKPDEGYVLDEENMLFYDARSEDPVDPKEIGGTYTPSKKISSSAWSDEEYTFIMPDNDLRIAPAFRKEDLKITLSSAAANGKVVSTSKTVHVSTRGKTGNPKKVTVTKKVTKKAAKLKKGKTLKLKARMVKAKKVKVRKHRAISYESLNPAKGHNLGAPVVSEIKEATCEENGVARVTYSCEREGCGFYKEEQPDIPALGHDWARPSYEWAEDNSAVTATCFCTRDESHVLDETAEVTREIIKPATPSQDGEMQYTAAFANAPFSTQIKTEVIPATGKIKVKKKTKKGTYKMKVTVTAAGSDDYETARKTVTVVIKVKK